MNLFKYFKKYSINDITKMENKQERIQQLEIKFEQIRIFSVIVNKFLKCRFP